MDLQLRAEFKPFREEDRYGKYYPFVDGVVTVFTLCNGEWVELFWTPAVHSPCDDTEVEKVIVWSLASFFQRLRVEIDSDGGA